MDVTSIRLGSLDTNCYLAVNGSKALAVDPGGEPTRVLARLDKLSAQLTHVLVTHFHFDHVEGAAALSLATGAPVLASPEGAPLLDTWVGSGGQFGLPRITPFEYQELGPGETEFLGLKCHVLATPGHAPGSLSFHFPEAGVVFVGDLLFARSIGRTDFQGGDLDLLRNSVQEKIFTLPPDTVVDPGHGPATTVGAEKAHNPFFADW